MRSIVTAGRRRVEMYTSADVTVGIVCRHPELLPRCFDGVLAQTATPARVLVIDHDCLPAVTVDDFVLRNLRCPVDVVRLESCNLPAETRNHALTLCRTPLLAWLDPAVVPSPDWLELMVDAIVPRCHCLARRAEKVVGVGGKTDYLNRGGAHAVPPRNYGERALDDAPCLWSGNAIYKVAALQAVGGYPAVPAGEEDAALGARLRQEGQVMLYVPGIVAAEL
ncbi:MAG: glycosyltransferase family A protein [Victivallales bacterium]|nr:glycosyltransferase family A protein [Victivallales bacterium]